MAAYTALVDMSAAFDTVYHALLLNKLVQCYAICGKVYDWISSYLKDRSQPFYHQLSTSTRRVLKYGVPQCSILGSVLFLLYTGEIIMSLTNIIFNHNVMRITVKFIQAVNQTRRMNSLN